MDELATITVRSGDCYLVAHIAACSNYHNSSSALWRAHANVVVFLREILSRMANTIVACSSKDLLIYVSIDRNGSNATVQVRQSLSFSPGCNTSSAECHTFGGALSRSGVSIAVGSVWYTPLVSCQIDQVFLDNDLQMRRFPTPFPGSQS